MLRTLITLKTKVLKIISKYIELSTNQGVAGSNPAGRAILRGFQGSHFEK